MVTTDPSSNQWSPPDYRVFLRRSWVAPWTDYGRMSKMQITQALGSEIGSATWNSYRGNLAIGEASPAIGGAQFDALVGSWCKIVWTPPYPEPKTAKTWYGFLTDVSRSDLGGEAVDYQCTAHSVEWLLTRHQLTKSRVEILAGATNAEIKRAIEINGFRSDQFSRQITNGNMSQVPNIDGVRVFAKDLSNPAIWNAKEYLKYLLQYYSPGSADTPLWRLDLAGNADNVLAWYEPQLNVHGRSLFEIINALIPRQRGLVWWTEVDEASRLIAIKLATTVRNPIALNSHTIPANASRITLDPVSQAHVNRSSLKVSEQQAYQQVCVIGDRAGAVFTTKFGVELESDWTEAEEGAYKTAASAATGYSLEKFSGKAHWNDSARMSQDLRHVYSRFKLSDNWDGTAGGHVITTNPFWKSGIRFESYLPLKQGFQYASPDNPTQEVDGQSEGRQEPFVVIALEPTTKFEYVDKLASTAFEEQFSSGIHWACNIQMMRDKAGFSLNPQGCPHLIAKRHFDVAAADVEPTEQWPLVDFDTIEATVFARLDSYCSGEWPSTLNMPARLSDLDSIHYIQIGDRAQLISMPEGTIVGLKDGDIVRSDASGFVRDDRKLCEDIARAAWEYYGQPRKSINLSLSMVSGHVDIGQLVTTYEGETVNSIVSAITWDFASNTTTINTRYAELDFAGLA